MAIPVRSRAFTRYVVAAVVGSLVLGLIAAVTFTLHGSGDYLLGAPVGGDNAAPGIAALLHGNLAGYATHQPIMGLTTILLRLPFAGAAALLGAGNLTIYEAGALACVIPLALVAAWLMAAPGLSSDSRIYGLVAVLVLILSPVLRTALGAGHPEGILAGVLATAAVIAGSKRRVRAAAILLGLAIGSQDWALIALPPVLVALPGRRRQVLLTAGVVAALLTAAVWASDPAGFLRALDNEGATRFLTPMSLLWPLAAPLHLPNASVEWVRAMPFGMRRPEATALSMAIVGAVGAAAYLGVRRRRFRYDPLALLALLGLLRCVCDSTHEEYYGIAALIPVLAWEAKEGRLAILGALMSIGAWSTYSAIGHVSATDLYVSTLGIKVLMVGYFARRAIVFTPATVTRLAPRQLNEIRVGAWQRAESTIPVATEPEPLRA